MREFRQNANYNDILNQGAEEGQTETESTNGGGGQGNRYSLPYGLCASEGINADGMTPREAWDAWTSKTGRTKEDAEREHWGKEASKKNAKNSPASGKLSAVLPNINNNPDWAYQPDDKTDLTDLKQNPIPYVGIGKDFEIGTAVEDARQKEYKSNVDIDISKLETFQPFVLGSGIDDYKHWDNTERPYVVEYKNHFYLLDGNHRVAKAKLEGKKTIKVDLSVRIDKKKI